MTSRLISALALLGLLVMSFTACGPECPEGQTKCGEKCVFLQIDANNCGECDKKCGAGNICEDGKCKLTCQKDLTECEGTCVNTKSSNAHCGACGTTCKDGETCQEGECKPSCPDGQTNCSGLCINTDDDVNNCGGCDTKCKTGEVCNKGKCELTCADGQSACAGQCVNTKTDRAHCGACDTKCEDGQVCADGKCAATCKDGTEDCSGSCVDTKTDRAHCGACGTACKAGEICKEGKCTLVCEGDYKDCNGACVNTKVSEANCGACGTACKAGEICKEGKCEISCPKDLALCTDKCVDLQSDAANCGQCGTACATGEVCQSGKCAILCQKDFTNCNGACVDLQTNASHCGKCGTACPTGYTCDKGACTPPACPVGESQCNNTCVDLMTDTANCGACGTTCKAGEVCLKGACSPCSDCPNFVVPVGGEDSQYGRAITSDANGNIYVAGYFYDFAEFGSTTLTAPSTSPEIFVAKLSPSGKTMWAKRAGGSSSDYAYGIAVDSKGNVYITGGYNSSADFGTTKLSSTGSTDIYVAALDKDGKWLWAKGYGSSSSDYGYDVSVDSKDNVVVAGYFYNSITIDTTTLSSKGSADIFVMQYDNTGKVTWAKSYGSTGTDYGYGLHVDGSDNAYVTGVFSSSMVFGSTTLSSKGSYDIYVIKLDSAGKEGWGASVGGTSSDYGYDVTADKSGNVYVAGYFSSSSKPVIGSTTLSSKGGNDIFVGKIDSTGKWEWGINAGSTSSDYAYGITADSKGNIFVTGYFYNTGMFGSIPLTAPSSSTEIFVMQLDDKGKVVGAIQAGGLSSDYAYDLHVGAKDALYLTGYGSKLMNFGKVQQVMFGGTDMFVAKYPARGTDAICPNTGYTICTGVCTETATDTKNCGTCGTTCKATEVCEAGKCGCATGQSFCNNACIDTNGDVNNCGGCGTKCGAGAICATGKCVSPPANVYLQEINTGGVDYVAIKNYGLSDVDLKGLYLYVNWDTDFGDFDINEPLPSYTLKSNTTVYCVESSAQTGEIKVPTMLLVKSDNITAMLCFGPCKDKDGSNVLDIVYIGVNRDYHTNIIFGNQLECGGTRTSCVIPKYSSSDSDATSSYVRTAQPRTGIKYDHKAWSIGPKTRP